MEQQNLDNNQQNYYGAVARKYLIKFKIIPYAILVSGISLTIFTWQNSREVGCVFTQELYPYGILLFGFSLTAFIFGLLFLYIRSYDWAVIMADATTRKIKEKTKELAQKVEIIEDKNRNLVNVRKTMLNLMSDISIEKVKIEEEKVRREALLESIGEGMVACDKDGTVEFMNKAAETMTGWKNEDIIGKKFFKAIIVQDELEQEIPRELRPLRQALSTGKKVTSSTIHPLYFIRKNKTKFPVAVVTAPVILDKTITGAIMVFRDITREWDIDRSKTEFVSLASHQLRTPLSTISWYAEMLLAGDAGKLSKEQEDYMKEIYNGNRRMVELVNALLNVSRIELGTLAIESEPTEFASISESVIGEIMPSIKAKGLKLKKKYGKEVPLINSDPKLIRIIFQNFLTNSIKYTPEKGTITVEIARQDPDVLIKVSDNGYGIPAHQQDKIFSKLFRADNAREKETEGTGLGLYIVKLIVEASRGKIWFESEENKGTAFYVTIPLSGITKKQGTKKLIEQGQKPT
jgi:PAS domain S-box-containing protein